MTCSFTVQEVLNWVAGRIVRPPLEDKGSTVSRLVPLRGAGRGDLCFFFAKKYQADVLQSAPTILVLGEPFVQPLLEAGLPSLRETWVLACQDPYVGLARASVSFSEEASFFSGGPGVLPDPQIHPTAVVHASVSLGLGVQVGPHCVIEEGTRIGVGTCLQSGVTVGKKVEIGADCVLFPRVTLYARTRLGNRVRLHAGAVLGADGFGYAPLVKDGQVAGHQKIHHLGRVWVGDEVEIGANSTVDRGTLSDTVIESHVKIDNLVHLAHNVRVGEGAILCGAVAIAGNAVVGRYAYLGGAVGVVNDVAIGDRALVGGMTLVSKNIPPGGKVAGNPQRDHREHFRLQAALNLWMKKKKELA